MLLLPLVFMPSAALGGYVTMQRNSLQAYPDAKCLDGSPGVYYHYSSSGGNNNNNKWYIEMQGGGWCHDAKSCKARATTGQWGSSVKDRETLRMNRAFFSTSPEINPLMHDWNRVYLRYCDGFSFSGNGTAPVAVDGDENTALYSNGIHILEAVMTDLILGKDLDKATDVVIGGCSAGGLSAMLHCDRWAGRIREFSSLNDDDVKVVCAPESGFFLDYNKTASAATYGNLMRGGLDFHQPVLPSKCVADQQDPSRCVYAEDVLKYVETPVFIMQPLYDDWRRGAVVLSNGDADEINRFGATVQRTVVGLFASSPLKNGAFLDSCTRHCGGEGVEIRGIKKPEALQRWYERQQHGDGDDYIYVQRRNYPCEDCCQGSAVTLNPTTTMPTIIIPSDVPSQSPSLWPRSAEPSNFASELLVLAPVNWPSESFGKTTSPSNSPSDAGVFVEEVSSRPTQPTALPSTTQTSSNSPSVEPTSSSVIPSSIPTHSNSEEPSQSPSRRLTVSPTHSSSGVPSQIPSAALPSALPTSLLRPSIFPSAIRPTFVAPSPSVPPSSSVSSETPSTNHRPIVIAGSNSHHETPADEESHLRGAGGNGGDVSSLETFGFISAGAVFLVLGKWLSQMCAKSSKEDDDASDCESDC